MPDLPILNFTTRVLGHDAAYRLIRKEVIQTIRSDKEAKPFSLGQEILVALDGAVVGKAYVGSLARRSFGSLVFDDAKRGGFATMSDLEAAVRRAGYRFKPFEDYSGNVVRFEWLDSEDSPQWTALLKSQGDFSSANAL